MKNNVHPMHSFLGICLFLLAFESIHADSKSDWDTIRAVIQDLRTPQACSLQFRQELFNAVSGQTITGYGTVTISAPSEFIWKYVSDPKNILSSDGKFMMMVLPLDQQVMIEPVEKDTIDLSPLSMLTDSSNISELFTMKRLPAGGSDLPQYELKPVTPSNQYESLILEIPEQRVKKDFSLIIFDQTGSRNKLTFSGYEVIPRPPSFRPEIPESYDVTDFSGSPIMNPFREEK
jgi:outer membrane lipoprotein-sorting protein